MIGIAACGFCIQSYIAGDKGRNIVNYYLTSLRRTLVLLGS